jgi:dTDP-glucose pyrophosphorylase
VRKLEEKLARATFGPDATIRRAMEALGSGGIHIALMVDADGRFLGLATDGDIRRALLAGAALEDPVAPHAKKKGGALIMSPGADRAAVLDLMRARAIEAIPIVDAEGFLAGVHLIREIVGAVPRPNWAVIMAGGRGTRFAPVTDTLPKPMIPVAGRPMLERLVLHLVGFGVKRIFLSVRHLAAIVEKHFGDGSSFGCRIEYLREDDPLGTAGALSLLPERPAHPLLVLNGDLVTDVDVGQLLHAHEAGGHAATLGTRIYAHSVPFGVLGVEGGRVVEIVEKPLVSWTVNAGIYALAPRFLDSVPRETAVDMPDLIVQAIARGESVGAFHLSGEWSDVARPADLMRVHGRESKE